MTSFSVKKPFTVFVAVVAILVFGVMSYVKMTPDLMPNMDYPYVVVVTTYPGAAPEEVEAVVTKPMEQSMATLNDIKTVTSTSAENYSMLVLEFEQSTNMDSAVVDILQKTQMLTGRWDDSIGTPSIIRINPNMIPVMVAAVDSSEMDRYELSRFAKDTVIPALEGTTGVASITTGGMIERTMTIEVNEAKLDKMNAKIAEAIDKAMEDARKQLEDAQKELDENREKVEAGTNQLLSASSGISDSIKQGEDDLADTLTAAGETAAKLASARAAIDALNARLEQAEAALAEAEARLAETDARIASLEADSALYAKALEGEADCGGLVNYNCYSGEPVAGLAQGCPLFVRRPDARLNLANFSRAQLYSAMATLKLGMDILLEGEGVPLDTLCGHGGLFKTPIVGQRLLAGALGVPVAVMETAGEGGPWGMAVLAAYMLNRRKGETLERYLADRVFAAAKGSIEPPQETDRAGFARFMERYKKGLAAEQAAAEALQ